MHGPKEVAIAENCMEYRAEGTQSGAHVGCQRCKAADEATDPWNQLLVLALDKPSRKNFLLLCSPRVFMPFCVFLFFSFLIFYLKGTVARGGEKKYKQLPFIGPLLTTRTTSN